MYTNHPIQLCPMVSPGARAHVDKVHPKASTRLHILRHLKRSGASKQDMTTMYTASIRSIMEYACHAWSSSLTTHQADLIEYVQKRVMRIIHPELHYTEALVAAQLPTLKERHSLLCLRLFTNMQSDDHKLNHLLPRQKN